MKIKTYTLSQERTAFPRRLIALIMAVLIVVSAIPMTVLARTGRSLSDYTIVTDPATINSWKESFPTGNTENAGAVWTDKFVVSGSDNILGKTADDGNFLVGLSALGSTMTITTQATIATDTILVLDCSSSMGNNTTALVDAANDSIETLLKMYSDNRIAVVAYAQKAAVILPLGRYKIGDRGQYITRVDSTQHIKLADGVTYENDANVTSSNVEGQNTNTASGIMQARLMFESATDTAERLPIMVIMSDGEATHFPYNYQNNDPQVFPQDLSTYIANAIFAT